MIFPVAVTANTPAYCDISGHWAEEYIEKAAAMGLIQGHPGGKFDPDSPITLAEVLAMLVPVVTGLRPEITDSQQWYTEYVNEAFECGILNNFTQEELVGFYDSPALRLMINVLFDNTLVSLKLSPPHRLSEKNAAKALVGIEHFTDSGDLFNDLYIISAYSCFAHEIIQGNDKRELAPYSYLTRAEAVTMLLRLKIYQLKRNNGMHYIDPFTYKDYAFTCIQTTGGQVFPIADTGRPIIKDNGIVYMTADGIAKILEACEADFTMHPTLENDIYYGFYDYYIHIPSSDFYSHVETEENNYGYSNYYEGYISNREGKKFEFVCAQDTDASIVLRNLPMLPVEEVLDFFQIPYKQITTSSAKTSVIVVF
ncbi:MAG: S-layer homology domain-containing protein [Clostridia bacterium]|nr:S-layer homology domain-containing protein [Clostridia bacterium]